MLEEKLRELAKEAREAGDDNVAIILYTLLGAMNAEDIGALHLLAMTCQDFSKLLLARLLDE